MLSSFLSYFFRVSHIETTNKQRVRSVWLIGRSPEVRAAFLDNYVGQVMSTRHTHERRLLLHCSNRTSRSCLLDSLDAEHSRIEFAVWAKNYHLSHPCGGCDGCGSSSGGGGGVRSRSSKNIIQSLSQQGSSGMMMTVGQRGDKGFEFEELTDRRQCTRDALGTDQQ